MSDVSVRPATSDDCPTIVEFNCRLALETEDHELDPDAVRAGVQTLLADESKGRYFVACAADRIVGQVMHTREWSDWRNGDIWWLQSVYVIPEFRGRGVFRTLFGHLRDQSESDPNVVGLRLYVENGNTHAQNTYQKLGMHAAGYLVMQTFSK